MKREGVDRMFPFEKREISEWDSRYELKIINRRVLIRFLGNPNVYQATESNHFTAVRAIGAHKALFDV